eukprot:31415-Eustigmatos_ZCMA.PRE.1
MKRVRAACKTVSEALHSLRTLLHYLYALGMGGPGTVDGTGELRIGKVGDYDWLTLCAQHEYSMHVFGPKKFCYWSLTPDTSIGLISSASASTPSVAANNSSSSSVH